jgi:two-component system sensor histidine kinase PilS (NtrC family)
MNVAGFYLVAYLSGSLVDELKKSSRREQVQQRNLHQLELLHWNIVQSMTSGLIMVDHAKHIRFANLAASEILELRGAALEGRSIAEVFPVLDLAAWSHLQRRDGSRNALETVARNELLFRKHSGEELCLGYTISVLQKDPEGRLGWVLIFQDLTKLKAMQEHVKRLEKVALAGRIAAEIAHEIKNPLAAMSGAVQMLRDEIQRDSVHSRLMQIVEREIHRINELVVDFLWLAKGAKKPEAVQEISLCQAIQETVALLRAERKVGLSRKVTTQFDASPVVAMDPQHFRQIIWNLLLNGLEAIGSDGELHVRVSEGSGNGAEGTEARIDIQDTGCGIPPEMRDRIFEPFFSTKQGGTGLGLSIVYQLIENAGGRITVSHLHPRGTAFSLFFPGLS